MLLVHVYEGFSISANTGFLTFFASRYDAEATYFDEGVRTAKRKQLEEKLLQVILAYSITLQFVPPLFLIF